MALTPASLRLDLKCGKGAISPGEKCTKGPATKAQPKRTNNKKLITIPKDYPGKKQPYGTGLRSKAENALIAAGQTIALSSSAVGVTEMLKPPAFMELRPPYTLTTSAVGSTLHGIGLATKARRLNKEATANGKPLTKTQQKNLKYMRSQARTMLAIGALSSAAAYGIHRQGKRLQNMQNTKLFERIPEPGRWNAAPKVDPRRRELESIYASSASQRTRNRQNTFGSLSVLKGRLTQRTKRRGLERAFGKPSSERPPRRDSIWADGFTPMPDTYDI